MIVVTLRGANQRGISGKAISAALKKLWPKMSWHCDICIAEESSYEFVPRIAERHPCEEISFLLSKHGMQYLIGVVPLNPRIKYREIIFSVQEFKRLVEGKWEEVTYEQVKGGETKDFEILCAEIAEKLLQEIKP